MRSIVNVIVLLSMFIGATQAAAQDVKRVVVGTLAYGAIRAIDGAVEGGVIRQRNKPVMKWLELQAKIQEGQVAAQTYIMALNANDRQQLLTTINQKLASGQSFKVEELEAMRIARSMLAVSVNQPVGSVTIGRGAEYGGYGGAYGAGGYEDGYMQPGAGVYVPSALALQRAAENRAQTARNEALARRALTSQ